MDYKPSTNLFLLTTKISWFILLFLFLGINLFFRHTEIVLSVINYAFWLGSGIFLSIIAIGYSYYAWILNAKSFRDWYAKQKLYSWQAAWVDILPDEYLVFMLWVNRLIDPLGIFLGISIVLITLSVAFSS